MFDRDLRALKDRLFAPIALRIGPRIAPDVVTWLAFLAGILSAVLVWTDHARLGFALWIVNRALDGLDGTQARVHQRSTPYGAYLDIVLDFVVYAAIPAAMVLAAGTFRLAAAGVFLLASFYVNAASWMYLAAILEQRREGATARGEQTAVTMPPGLIAGTETVVLYSLFFLFPSARLLLFGISGVLVLVNVVIRLRWAKHALTI